MAAISGTRRHEIGLGRIKRLASSGLPIEPLVQSIWQIMGEALPHSPHQAFLPDPGERHSAYLGSTREIYGLLPAVQHYFVDSPPEISGYKVPYDQGTLTSLFPRKTIWLLKDLALPNFYRREGYNEVFAKLGWYDGAQLSLTDDGVAVGHYPIWYGRNQRPFDRQDLRFLEAVAPSITHALKVARRLKTAVLPSVEKFSPASLWGQGVILLDRTGRLVALDEEARTIFRQFAILDGVRADAFNASPVSDGLSYIADVINRVFRASTAEAALLPVPAVRFYSHWTGAVLKLRGALLQGVDNREFVNVTVERGDSGRNRSVVVRDRWGLTEREAQVLDLVAEGKTNPEIGIILGVSRLTVKKHLESIFRALGVETRTAAAAAVLGMKGL